VTDKALEKKVVDVMVKPKYIGLKYAIRPDLFVSKAYYTARKEYVKVKNKVSDSNSFQVQCYYTFDVKDTRSGEISKVQGKTIRYSHLDIDKFLDDIIGSMGVEFAAIKLETLKLEFQFVINPAGGKLTEARDYDSILNKKSVVKIINDDNNCFWYSLACCMNPNNKMVKDGRYPNTRIRLGSEICKKCNCEWNKVVPIFPHINIVEHIYNCNIYVINLNNIPILGSSVSLLHSDCLMYKSDNKNKEHYFLLYDEDAQHYHCITDIKKFLGVREFCYNCMKGFTSKTAYTNHECGGGEKKKKINYKTADKILKDLAHYLTPNFVKGSEGD